MKTRLYGLRITRWNYERTALLPPEEHVFESLGECLRARWAAEAHRQHYRVEYETLQ